MNATRKTPARGRASLRALVVVVATAGATLAVAPAAAVADPGGAINWSVDGRCIDARSGC